RGIPGNPGGRPIGMSIPRAPVVVPPMPVVSFVPNPCFVPEPTLPASTPERPAASLETLTSPATLVPSLPLLPGPLSLVPSRTFEPLAAPSVLARVVSAVPPATGFLSGRTEPSADPGLSDLLAASCAPPPSDLLAPSGVAPLSGLLDESGVLPVSCLPAPLPMATRGSAVPPATAPPLRDLATASGDAGRSGCAA